MTPSAADLALLAAELAMLACFATAGVRLATWLLPGADRLETLIAATLSAGTLAVVVVEVTGALGALRAPVLFVAALGFWIALRGWKARLPSAEGSFGRLSRAMRLLVVGVAAAATPAVLRALFEAPLDWDGNTYHLFYAARYLQQASLAPLAYLSPHTFIAYYPGNGDLLHTAAMAILRSDLLVRLPNFLFVVLVALAVARLARAIGAGPEAAAAAGLWTATTPALAAWIPTTYVEPLLDLALLAALLFAIRAATAEGRDALGAAAAAGLAAGFAAGTKYSALYFVAAVGVAIAGVAIARAPTRRDATSRIAAFAIAAVVAGGYWYLRNAVLTGNPCYPAAFLGLPRIEDPRFPWSGGNLLSLFWRSPDREWALASWFGGDGPGRSMTLGAKTIVVVPLAVWGAFDLVRRLVTAARRRDPATGAAVGFVLGGLAVLAWTYLVLPYWGVEGWLYAGTRFAVPAYALAVAAGFAALDRRLSRKGWLVLLATAGVVSDLGVANFRVPELSAVGSALVVLCAVVAAWAIAIPGRGAKLRRALPVAAAGALLLALPFAWSRREVHRYYDLATQSEVHPADQQGLARAADELERRLPRLKLAATASGTQEFLYLFVGRRLDREVVYVPTAARRGGGPGVGLSTDEERDRAAWREALGAGGVKLVFATRLRDDPGRWPIETRWARELHFPLFYRDDYSAVFEIPGEIPGEIPAELPAGTSAEVHSPKPG